MQSREPICLWSGRNTVLRACKDFKVNSEVETEMKDSPVFVLIFYLGYTSLHNLYKTRPNLPGGPEQEERDNKLTLSNAWVRAECWDKRHIDEVPEHESSNFKAWLSGHNAVQFLGQNHMSQSVEHRASEAYQGGLSLPQVAADSLLSCNMTGHCEPLQSKQKVADYSRLS
jgi:hypothetical protein